MKDFEELLKINQLAVERFVKFKISDEHDAEDILQDVYLNAYRNFGQLKSEQSFKAWIVGIARNVCNGYFRKKHGSTEIPFDEVPEQELLYSRFGYAESDSVCETIETLNDKDRQILQLYYWGELSQAEISAHLNIPLGTVKSRLHTAKQNFKEKYPNRKVDEFMKKLPEFLPEYKIIQSNENPFDVRCEELMGLSIIPKAGEKTVWGLYNSQSRKCEEYSETKVCGKAAIHGIEGVEITSTQHNLLNSTSRKTDFVAQLTETHCRYLAATHYDKDVKKQFTFLDDIFMKNWAFGKDNCGNEILIKPKNLIKRQDNVINTACEKETSDIVGRYTVEIGDKVYDTVCVMNVGHFGGTIVIEQYLDKNGRTVLWRRFNKNDWAFKRFGKTWEEMLPENEKLIINGETFVLWYDCITDYIL